MSERGRIRCSACRLRRCVALQRSATPALDSVSAGPRGRLGGPASTGADLRRLQLMLGNSSWPVRVVQRTRQLSSGLLPRDKVDVDVTAQDRPGQALLLVGAPSAGAVLPVGYAA